jgi:hypothetical protein
MQTQQYHADGNGLIPALSQAAEAFVGRKQDGGFRGGDPGNLLVVRAAFIVKDRNDLMARGPQGKNHAQRNVLVGNKSGHHDAKGTTRSPRRLSAAYAMQARMSCDFKCG